MACWPAEVVSTAVSGWLWLRQDRIIVDNKVRMLLNPFHPVPAARSSSHPGAQTSWQLFWARPSHLVSPLLAPPPLSPPPLPAPAPPSITTPTPSPVFSAPTSSPGAVLPSASTS